MTDQIATPSVEQPGTQQPPELIWSDLLKKFIEFLMAEGKGKQERNYRTAFNFFLESTGLMEDSLVGAELGEEFEVKIKIYIEFQIGRGLARSTYGPRVSKIRALKKFAEINFTPSLLLQTLPQALGQRLRRLIALLGHTIKSFWRTLPDGLVSYNKLLHWCNGQSLRAKNNLMVIETVEAYLGVPLGTLRLPKCLHAGRPLKVGQSDAGNKMRAAIAKPYYVWTASLAKEFQSLVANKTLAILPEGEKRHNRGQWTKSDGAGFPSAKIFEDFLKSFMGYCALPRNNPDPYLRGWGLKLEELSLALLADKELVEAYLEFKKLRSGLRVRPVEESAAASLNAHEISANGLWEFYDKGGKYNSGSLGTLAFISSLLRPSTGYLYQHPEFGVKLGPRMTASSWQEQCVQTRSRVDDLHRTISLMKKEGDQENYDFGRDPKEPIQWILDLPRPLLVLQEALKAMLSDLLPDNASKLERARQYRNVILFALLCANPLRIRMFAIMEFDKHLIRRSNGSWWVRFNRRSFKNRRSINSHYEVRVAEELWPLLDRYLKEFHPVLAGATGSKYVFIRSAAGPHKHPGGPLSSIALSSIIQELTELYIPGGKGFRPHAFRHIIATDIIKKDRRLGFFLASIALHDKLDTVKREYIHLSTSEFFEPVNAHFSEAWRLVFNSLNVGLGQQSQ
jgi:integrase